MIAELDPGQGYQQVGRRNQWAQQVDGLADDGGTGHFNGGDAVMAGCLGENR
ncbi:hypothetical protein D3C78_1969220 [compost metagenome]